MLSINQLAATHSPYNFSAPTAFQPERFLNTNNKEDTATTANNTTSVFQPFGMGRHHCLGFKVAWAELRLVLARILYAFDVDAATAEPPGDFALQKTFLVWEKEPLLVKLRARSGAEMVRDGAWGE